MTIFLLGAIPPPLGGVSVYCMRKLNSLRLQNIDVRHFDSRYRLNLIKLFFLFYFYKLKRSSIEVEVNVSNKIVLFFLFVTGISSSCVFVDHNSYRRLKREKFGEAILIAFCHKALRIKAVNINIVNYYESKGINMEKVTLMTPYLKPTEAEVGQAVLSLPKKYHHLAKMDQRNIILCSAWRSVSTESELDLYGILDTLEVYKQLLPLYPEVNFVLMIGIVTEDAFGSSIRSKIESLKVFPNFIFIDNGASQLPFLKNTLALLRLTKTDGDSVSVREALDFGANVIASNVCPRPEGVICITLDEQSSVVDLLTNIINNNRGYL
ncbi:hypothetical protein I6F65_13295 [Pseudoalteromonas sp. SWXJZ94C]|uniref:hypothetical protein n=1 Tax=Pseudoalteromonas sp. SWXJZ94C TaxID=2792065 RepID=UPI0018CF6AC1|nr:hypothetical protein [Pseudoalteromonas sp. SWXJZ94C]MBH0057936.1 hypothetical protein [Pseudoalteromonas sp. SWXJZ94C]